VAEGLPYLPSRTSSGLGEEHKDETYSADLGGVKIVTRDGRKESEDRRQRGGSWSISSLIADPLSLIFGSSADAADDFHVSNSPKRTKGKMYDSTQDDMDELPAQRIPTTSKLRTARTLGANAGVLVEDASS